MGHAEHCSHPICSRYFGEVRRTGERFNIKTVFKTRYALRSMLIGTRRKSKVQDIRQFIYSIPCECGRYYIGKRGRPLGVRIEHMDNLKQVLMEKSRLAKHAYEEGHRIRRKEAKVVQKDTNNIRRKYKEVAHMACVTNPTSQPSFYEEVVRLHSSSMHTWLRCTPG
jgi:hypothetical protein